MLPLGGDVRVKKTAWPKAELLCEGGEAVICFAVKFATATVEMRPFFQPVKSYCCLI